MKPLPAVMFWVNELTKPIDRNAPPSAASAAGDDHRDVARRVDRDADRLGRPRVLADRPQPQADRRPEDTTRRDDRQRARARPSGSGWPSALPKNRASTRSAASTSGICGEVVGRALVAVDVDEQVAGEPEREEVQRGAADDLVRPQLDRRRTRGSRPAPPPASDPDERARAARSRSCRRPRRAKNAPISIMPSRPMFTTPLRSEKIPPSAGEDQRGREAQHRGDQRDQTTTSRLATLDSVASVAEPERRRSPRRRAPQPSAAARRASRRRRARAPTSDEPRTGSAVPHLERRQRDEEARAAPSDDRRADATPRAAACAGRVSDAGAIGGPRRLRHAAPRPERRLRAGGARAGRGRG